MVWVWITLGAAPREQEEGKGGRGGQDNNRENRRRRAGGEVETGSESKRGIEDSVHNKN